VAKYRALLPSRGSAKCGETRTLLKLLKQHLGTVDSLVVAIRDVLLSRRRPMHRRASVQAAYRRYAVKW